MPLADIIREEIERDGPLPFSRFMELALYHPGLGYYRRGSAVFGREGDFYTNAQLQPVFGRLVAQQIDRWRQELGAPAEFCVVELGAGRGETAEVARRCLPGVRWTAIEMGCPWPDEPVVGVVFSNEFFDALPVDSVERRSGGWVERRVGRRGEGFDWVLGSEVQPRAGLPDCPAGNRIESCERAMEQLERIDRLLQRGFVLSIDYGYTHGEIAMAGKFPQGSLMAYKNHRADPDVLLEPGERDITAHVNFTALVERGKELGWETLGFSPQQEFLARAGAGDNFAYALGADTEDAAARLRMQLKTLLFGMGETFRVLLQRKG